MEVALARGRIPSYTPIQLLHYRNTVIFLEGMTPTDIYSNRGGKVYSSTRPSMLFTCYRHTLVINVCVICSTVDVPQRHLENLQDI